MREVFGVPLKKLRRTVREIERKTFHMMGLLVPLIYQLLLGIGWTEMECATLCWGITIGGWVADLSRIYIPFVRDNWPLRSILREHEQGQLSGGCFFSLGCTLAITLFSHATATASIAFLVVGDMRYGYCHLSFTASPKRHITHPHAPTLHTMHTLHTLHTPAHPAHRIHTLCTPVLRAVGYNWLAYHNGPSTHRIHTHCVASATRCYACPPSPHTCAGNVFASLASVRPLTSYLLSATTSFCPLPFSSSSSSVAYNRPLSPSPPPTSTHTPSPHSQRRPHRCVLRRRRLRHQAGAPGQEELRRVDRDVPRLHGLRPCHLLAGADVRVRLKRREEKRREEE